MSKRLPCADEKALSSSSQPLWCKGCLVSGFWRRSSCAGRSNHRLWADDTFRLFDHTLSLQKITKDARHCTRLMASCMRRHNLKPVPNRKSLLLLDNVFRLSNNFLFDGLHTPRFVDFQAGDRIKVGRRWLPSRCPSHCEYIVQ